MKYARFFLFTFVFALTACNQTVSEFLLLQTPFPKTSPDEPQLVIDPHGHSDMVMNVIFSPDGSTLVSVSRDKTIRVWDVKSGEPLKTFRGQLGQGPEGMLYAGALSPDGKILALGGFLDRFGGKRVGNIRLLELESGEQIGLLTGHENIVTTLAFSPDGTWLASGSADRSIKIWNLSDPYALDEDEGVQLPDAHQDRVQQLVFSPNGGTLVSASYDGTLRLWEFSAHSSGSLKEVRERQVLKQHRAEVRCVVFSPDGRYIISGGYDRKILLWGADGNFLKEIDTLDGKISALAVSADSRRIVAVKQHGITASVYAIPSGEKIASFGEHDNVVPAAAFYGDATIATAGGDYNDIYLWDALSGSVRTHIVGTGRKVWALGSGTHLNIAFGNSNTAEELLKEPFEKSFDFSEMFLNRYPPLENEFKRVQIRFQDMRLRKLSEWQLEIAGAGKITNDAARDRWIRSYSFTPDGDVVVGSDFSLKLYRTNGELLRQFIGHTGAVWAVSISEDGRILASAGNDQTLKLWNLKTAECLATLFVASDNEWVCWTPQGYYAASAGGEKYIGWHLNQGEEKSAEYYPVSVFRKRFHRPALVKRTILVGHFEKAFGQIDAEMPETLEQSSVAQVLPPKVQWIQPGMRVIESQEASIQIKAEVFSDRPLTAVKVLVNGRNRAAGERGLDLGGERSASEEQLDGHVDREVPLNPGRNTISIFASHADAGATSEEYIVLHKMEEAEQAQADLYMVSIGISQYGQERLNLEFADDDARAMSHMFRAQEGSLYPRVSIQELYDADATKNNILESLDWLKQEATHKDVALFFVAAHGYNDEDGQFYVIPADGDPDDLQRTSVNWEDFAAILGNLPGRVLLFLDTCHSGRLGENLNALRKQVDNTEAIRTLASDEYGAVILAASTGREFSLEHADWGHGAFTKSLIEAIGQGRADFSGDGLVNLRELDVYIADRVESLTSNTQHPTTQKPSTISRFPIAQVK